MRPVVARDGVVILDGREVVGALDVATNEVSNRRLSESAVAGEQARVVDQMIDQRVGVRPVHPGS